MAHRHKNWDDHVVEAEDIARSDGFASLRDRIVGLARPQSGEAVVDVGAGTGLLSLAVAPLVTRVWAIDISAAMVGYLQSKAASAALTNVEATVGSAVSLPLVDRSADLVLSNYCYHHLRDCDKERALAEAFRVLRPGGRLVVGDMMFRVDLVGDRNRRIVLEKIASMLRRGPAGVLRLLKNVVRYLTRRWEHPATADWWHQALHRAGFREVEIHLLDHEGGIASARRPVSPSAPA